MTYDVGIGGYHWKKIRIPFSVVASGTDCKIINSKTYFFIAHNSVWELEPVKKFMGAGAGLLSH